MIDNIKKFVMRQACITFEHHEIDLVNKIIKAAFPESKKHVSHLSCGSKISTNSYFDDWVFGHSSDMEVLKPICFIDELKWLSEVINEPKIKEEMKFEHIKLEEGLSEGTRQHVKESNAWLDGINNRIKEEEYSIEYNERQIKILQDGIAISKRQIEHYVEGATQAKITVKDIIRDELNTK